MTDQNTEGVGATAREVAVVHRFVRRAMSLLSGLAFFGLIVAEFLLGITTKDIPMFLYVLLASLAVVSHDRFGDMAGKLIGGKGAK